MVFFSLSREREVRFSRERIDFVGLFPPHPQFRLFGESII
jgi:hypothetical protein